MIRHVVMLRWFETATTEDVDAVSAALSRLPGQIDAVRNYSFGSDAGVSEGNWDFAIVADFDDEAGYADYRDHEAHLRAIKEHIKPILEDRSAVQFRI